MSIVETNKTAFDKLSESKQLYILKTLKKSADEMPKIEEDTLRQVEFLKANGFVEEEHFEWSIKTYKRQDYVYVDNSDESYERFYFEFDTKCGYIQLISKKFYGASGISIERTNVQVKDGLIEERGYIMKRRGHYKPKTIIDRIKFLSEYADNMEAQFHNKLSNLNTAMDDLSKFYPMAEITTHKNYDWRINNYNQNADVIRVQFASGSYVKLVIASNGDYEIIKAHDAELSNLTTSQTLNKFRDQKQKENA
jgi:hypothetical protein